MDKLFMIISVFACGALCLMGLNAAGLIGHTPVDNDIAYIKALEKSNEMLKNALETANSQNGLTQNAIILILFGTFFAGLILVIIIFRHRENMAKIDGFGMKNAKAEIPECLDWRVDDNNEIYQIDNWRE